MLFVVLTIFMVAYNDKVDTVSVDDLLYGEIEDGAEVEVTGVKVKNDEEITVKGIYHNVEDSPSPVIRAKEINKE